MKKEKPDKKNFANVILYIGIAIAAFSILSVKMTFNITNIIDRLSIVIAILIILV